MTVDLRSDTLTRPTDAMRDAIAHAEVGDDVFGADPTVNALQREVAERFGKDAALFVPSGTMANQLTLLVYCRPGDHILVPRGAHIAHYEAGASAAIAGVLHAEVPLGLDGEDEDAITTITQAIQPDNHLYAPTRLITLEHTHNRAGGRVIPTPHIQALRELTRERSLPLHLDGARLFNALTRSRQTPAEIGALVDSLSICFSKGLGAPIGSLLIGSEHFIERAHRYRKMLGGGMRQAGILAAAARHALEHHVERLSEDHQRARALADGLQDIPHTTIDPDTVETNIVIFHLDDAPHIPDAAQFVEIAATHGLLCYPVGPRRVRWVTHLHITDEHVQSALAITRDILTGEPS